MKRKYTDISNYNQIIIGQKRRKLNDGTSVQIINSVNLIKNEVFLIRKDVNNIKMELDMIKKKLQDIEYFIGMKHKKFENNASYIC